MPALAASVRSKIAPPCPGAVSERVVVTALGGKSDLTMRVHMGLAQQDREGGSASV